MGYVQESIETELEQLIAAGKIEPRSVNFAKDLVAAAKRGSPSPKQVEWIGKLTAQAKAPADKPSVQVDPVVLELEQLIPSLQPRDVDFARDLVRACKAGQATPNRMTWVNKLAERGRAAKLDAGKAQAKKARREVVSRIAEKAGLKVETVDRVFERLSAQNKDVVEADLLEAFESVDKSALAAIAKDYADAEHSCCFCGIELTDERSTSKGYGPICAAKYGLPWGDTPEELPAAGDVQDAIGG